MLRTILIEIFWVNFGKDPDTTRTSGRMELLEEQLWY